MDTLHLGQFIVPLLVVALFARRVAKAQQARPVKLGRLWIFPALLLLGTYFTLSREPPPTLLTVAGFLLACLAGGALGWFRVHTLEFSIDPASGAIMSKASPFGALILVGLLAFRYGLKYLLNDEGVRGQELALWTDGAMLFTAAMMVAQSAHTYVRARRLKAPATALPEADAS